MDGAYERTGAFDKALVAGIFCLFLWTWLHYEGGCYSLRGFDMATANMRWLAHSGVAALAATVVCTLALRDRGEHADGLQRGMRITGSLCALLGTAAALAIVLVGPIEEAVALALVSGVLTGIGQGLLLCLFCSLTSHLGTRMSLAHIVAALAISAALMVACYFMPDWVGCAIGLVCPLICLAASSDARGPNKISEPPLDDPEYTAHEGRTGLLDKAQAKPLLQLGTICVVLGASSGFVGTSYELLPESFYQVSCLFVVLGTFMAAVLAYISHFRLNMGAWNLIFRVALPLMAVSHLLLPFPVYGFVGPGIHALGYQYFFMLLWPLLGSPRLRRALPALATIGGGLGAVQAGQVIGSALWLGTCAGAGEDPIALTIASGVAMLAALLLSVAFERPSFAWAEVRPGKQVDVGASPGYEELMALVGTRYGLSPREEEVLALIGHGHTRQEVADVLGISLQTAKTHVARIYHKLDVHSQREMLDVLEACREECGARNGVMTTAIETRGEGRV